MKKMFIALGIAFVLIVSVFVANTNTAIAETAQADTYSICDSNTEYAYDVVMNYVNRAMEEDCVVDTFTITNVDVAHVDHEDSEMCEFNVTLTGYDIEDDEYKTTTVLLSYYDIVLMEVSC